jgi:uncharacterized cupin superfamily protein
MSDDLSIARLDFGASERFQLLRRELGVTTFGLNLIVLKPGMRGRIHRHEGQEEVFLVLEGRLTLVTEGEERDLEQWELVRVAPHVRRQLVNRGPGDCALLAMGSANPHNGRDGTAFATWDDVTGGAPQETPLPEDLPTTELRTS